MTPVSALQQEARETIQEALNPFGYEAPFLRFGWQVPNSPEVRRYAAEDRGQPDQMPTGRARQLDALAFSDARQQDWNTSAIAVDLDQDKVVGTEASREQAKELFGLTASPTNLVGSLSRRKVDVWFNCHDGIIGSQGVDLQRDALQAALRPHRALVQRDLLAHLRQGQRHIFDGQLFARRDELASFLQRGVSKAKWLVQEDEWGSGKKQIAERHEGFSRVALALLAARILEDKGALGEDREQSTDARQLLADAKGEWDSFFDTVCEKNLPELERWFGAERVGRMTRCLLSHLTGPVNFALVTHEMLGDLYERALVAERSVESEAYIDLKGVHYTPLTVTRRILDRIPLEDLPLEHRTVCDFACGSGSFLLAATDRLAKLFDPREMDSPLDRTAWLKQSVMGNDIDPVAILVTELSYLVAYWNRVDEKHGVPFPNLHRKGDALKLDLKETFGRTPRVIVGNPPFDVKGCRATKFLDRALDVLLSEERPGYIGMVMPGVFLKGVKDQIEGRSRLLGRARILEVWELPEHTIGLCAETPTCVVIAEVIRSQPPVQQTIRICQTFSRQSEAVGILRDEGVTTWSYAGELDTRQTDQDAVHKALAFSPVDDVWSRVSGNFAFKSLTEAVWGFTHATRKGRAASEFSSTPGPDFVPYIKLQKAVIPYFLTEEDWRNSHKDENRYWKKGTGPWTYKANWPKYESPKIILSAVKNRNAQSQLVAALDFAKYYPGEHLLAMVLKKGWKAAFTKAYPEAAVPSVQDALRWLCAILNSAIGHAWVARVAAPRGPHRDVFLTIPLPRSYDPNIAQRLVDLKRMARPQNANSTPTWNPQSGLVSPQPVLFDDPISSGAAINGYWRAVDEINGLVLSSYGLTDQDIVRFNFFLSGMTQPWADHPSDVARLDSATTLRVLRGKTLSVNQQAQTIEAELLWKTLGNGKPVSIPIPKFMPGWALQSDREFTCMAPGKVSLAGLLANPWLLRDFAAVPYSYLSNEKLEEMIGFRTGASGK
jgi:hypothetical protein